MKNLLIFICILLLISGCVVDKEQEIPVISINSLIKNKLTLSDIAEDVRYIKIDSNPLFQRIRDVEKSDSIFFIYDLTNGILAYDNNCKFLHNIGNIGRGPGEYTSVEEIAVDNDSSSIFVLGSKNVLCFDFDGNFKYEFPVFENTRFTRLFYDRSKLYFFAEFFFGTLEFNWVITDRRGKVINNKSNSIEDFNSTIGITSNLGFNDRENIYYLNLINDTIFRVEPDGSVPEYLFADDDIRLSKEDIMNDDNFRKCKSWLLDYSLGNRAYLVFNYVVLNQEGYSNVQTVYDREKNRFYELNRTGRNVSGYINSFDNGLAFKAKEKFSDNSGEWFVQWIDAYELIAHVQSDIFKNSTPKYPEKKKELEQLANSLDENDNPVLMLVKLKE